MYPPTSPERRTCETTANHAFQNPSPSSKATAQAAHAYSSSGWMVQNVINYSSLGATDLCHRPPQAAKPRAPSPPPLAFKLMPLPSQERQIAHLGSLATAAKSTSHQSLPRSDPSKPRASKIEPGVLPIRAKRYPS